MSDMNGTKPKNRWPPIGVAATVSVCLVLLYVLSLGPVIGLAMHGYIGKGAIPYVSRFYAPLQYAQDKSRAAA